MDGLHAAIIVLFSIFLATLYLGIKVESLIKEFKQERLKMKNAAVAYQKLRRRR